MGPDAQGVNFSPVYRTMDEAVTWTVPANASDLWFVVTGAPTKYERHPWGSGGSDHDGEGDSLDNKWPWKAVFEGTKPYGKLKTSTREHLG